MYNQKSSETDRKIDFLKFIDMNIKGNNQDDILIDWSLLALTSDTAPLPFSDKTLMGVNLIVNHNGKTDFKNISKKVIVQLHSPGQLQVIDSNGRTSGLANGITKKEIPYSTYDEINEAVILFVDEGVEDDQYKYQVTGTDDANYGLTIINEDDSGGNQDVVSFDASGIPTRPSAIHQFTIDWDALARDEKGVTMQTDNNGDGSFEETIMLGKNYNLGMESQISITQMFYGGENILNSVTQAIGDDQSPLLLSELKESQVNLEEYTSDSKLNPGQKKKLKMKFKFLETAGNEFQGKSINVNFKFLAGQQEI